MASCHTKTIRIEMDGDEPGFKVKIVHFISRFVYNNDFSDLTYIIGHLHK